MPDSQLAAPEHVRAMLIKKVDEFIEQFKDDDGPPPGSVTLDHFGIVAICAWPDPDDEEGDKLEEPALLFSTRNLYMQLGILHASLLYTERKVLGG